MGISVTVCLCVCLCICAVTDFSAENKISSVKFFSEVHRRPRQGITHFCELCSPRNPKSNESANVSAYRVGVTLGWRKDLSWLGIQDNDNDDNSYGTFGQFKPWAFVFWGSSVSLFMIQLVPRTFSSFDYAASAFTSNEHARGGIWRLRVTGQKFRPSRVTAHGSQFDPVFSFTTTRICSSSIDCRFYFCKYSLK